MSSVFGSWIRLLVATTERRWLRLSVKVFIRSHMKQWSNQLQSQHYQHCSIVKLSLKCPDWPLTTTRPLSARATAGKALSLDLSRSSTSAPTLEARTPAIKRSRSSQEYDLHNPLDRREISWDDKPADKKRKVVHTMRAISIFGWRRWNTDCSFVKKRRKVKWRGLRSDEDRDREGRSAWCMIIII